MIVGAALTFIGAVIALIFLPETRVSKKHPSHEAGNPQQPLASSSSEKVDILSITALFSANRLVMAGILMSTISIFLKNQIGEQIHIAGHSFGIATLTGLGLGLSTLIAMVSAPLMGGVSDRVGNRWQVAAGGLIPGIVGFGLMALGLPLTILFGIPLIAMTSGSTQGLSTALTGDLGNGKKQSRRLGMLFTFGDFASAIGPPLAYALMPLIGIKSLYISSAGIFVVVFLVSVQRAKKKSLRTLQI
jgi:MFS family permease